MKWFCGIILSMWMGLISTGAWVAWVIFEVYELSSVFGATNSSAT
jgi:hypothetical protein